MDDFIPVVIPEQGFDLFGAASAQPVEVKAGIGGQTASQFTPAFIQHADRVAAVEFAGDEGHAYRQQAAAALERLCRAIVHRNLPRGEST
jgi:hypothetical protein